MAEAAVEEAGEVGEEVGWEESVFWLDCFGEVLVKTKGRLGVSCKVMNSVFPSVQWFGG